MQELIDMIAAYKHKCHESDGNFTALDEGKLSGLRTALRIWRRAEKKRAMKEYHERHGTRERGAAPDAGTD